MPIVLLLATIIVFPIIAASFQVAFVNSALIAAVGAMGLSVVMGLGGLVSAGNAALLAVGAYASATITMNFPIPFLLVVLLSALTGAAVGVIIGLPALRVQGLYLVIATLALHFVVIYFFNQYQINTVGSAGFFLPTAEIFGWRVVGNHKWYIVLIVTAALVYLGVESLKRSKYGRALMLLREAPLVAASQGIWLAKYKLIAFVLSSAIIAAGGSMLAYYQQTVYIEGFTLELAIQYIAMIIIGGVGSTGGAIAGAFFVGLLPTVLSRLIGLLPRDFAITNYLYQNIGDVQLVLYGGLVILFLMFQPGGLANIASRVSKRIDEFTAVCVAREVR